jgi:hypothetical protein
MKRFHFGEKLEKTSRIGLGARILEGWGGCSASSRKPARLSTMVEKPKRKFFFFWLQICLTCSLSLSRVDPFSSNSAVPLNKRLLVLGL